MHFFRLIRLRNIPPLILIVMLTTLYFSFMNKSNPTSLRNQELPFFEPHMRSFDCQLQIQKLPPIDAEADAWLMQSRTLESRDIPFSIDEYKQIVRLTQRAAARNHWKAILNLASFYLENLVAQGHKADSIKLVEHGMQLGIPAAYDRMGTYYIGGNGVGADVTRAYAFWQEAARMGNPEALEYLGEKLNASYESGDGSWWANRPVAIKMLTCAVGQGNGKAARSLSAAYSVQPQRQATQEEKTIALRVLHQGVKLGCEDCSSQLFVEFSKTINPDDTLAPYIDKDRGKRYSTLSTALGLDSHLRFPNLDKVLPLPPAPLPPWNGDRDTLLDAALGVTPVRYFEADISNITSRFEVPPPFALHNTGMLSKSQKAPQEGYWRPIGADHKPLIDKHGKSVQPGLYKQGELFPEPAALSTEKPVQEISWEYWITTWGDREAVEPRAPKDLIRVVPRPTPFVSSPADVPCPRTGTWQPWVPADHPLAQLINQHWRQAWVIAGQPFPQPKTDWWIDLPGVKITWHLMDDTPVNINQPVPPKGSTTKESDMN